MDTHFFLGYAAGSMDGTVALKYFDHGVDNDKGLVLVLPFCSSLPSLLHGDDVQCIVDIIGFSCYLWKYLYCVHAKCNQILINKTNNYAKIVDYVFMLHVISC
jgi:hypothetical protein